MVDMNVDMGLRSPKIKKSDRTFKIKRQRQDEIWQFVVLAARPSAAHKSDEELNNENAEFAYCLKCECKISFRIGKHGVKPHMKKYHMREILAYRRAREQQAEVRDTVRDFFKLRIATKAQVERSDEVLAMWLASSARPINLVSDVWFQIYVAVLTKTIGGVEVPSPRRTATSAIITRLASKMLKDELNAQCTYFCITTDGWTDRPGRGYISLTAHYINKTCEMKHWTLEVAPPPDRHTGETIANAVITLMNQWDRERCVKLLRDGASNAVATGRRLNVSRMSCVAHCLHLVVSGALIKKAGPKSSVDLLSTAITTEEFTEAHKEAMCKEMDAFLENEVAKAGQRALATVRGIVGSFRALGVYISRSQKASNWLTKAQRDHSTTALKVVLDCPTGWNSYRDMLVRMRTLEPWITKFFEFATSPKGRQEFADFKLQEPSPHDWLVIRALVVVLEPFMVASEWLSGVSYPTMTRAFPTLRALHSQLSRTDLVPTDDTSPMASAVKTLMDCVRRTFLTAFEERFPAVNASVDNGLVWITLLDPKFRAMQYLSEAERQTANRRIDEMVAHERGDVAFDRETAEDSVFSIRSPERTPKRIKREMMESIYGPQARRPEPARNLTVRTRCIKEVDQYFDCTTATLPKDSLGWWKTNESSFPGMAALSRKWLCCMATTVPSERAFSTGGNTVTAKRCSLGESMVRNMVFLAENQRAFIDMPKLTPFRHLFEERKHEDSPSTDVDVQAVL